jgi:hypothetical protein
MIRVYAVRTVRWRGVFAVHTWIVVKERGAPHYTRYDYTAWGEPVRVDGFPPDDRWFGAVPATVVSVDGEIAERLIPKIRSVIQKYRFSSYGDYRPWPGPTSNTFVQAALDAVPELKAVLPPTAIGKDYPYSRRMDRRHSVRHRCVCDIGRLCRPDHRLGRRRRVEFVWRCAWARSAPAGAEVSRPWSDWHCSGFVARERRRPRHQHFARLWANVSCVWRTAASANEPFAMHQSTVEK